MSLTYSQAMELPCDFPEICAVAEVLPGTAFAIVLLKLISMIENLRGAKGPRREVEITVRYGHDDAGGNGLDKEGKPLTREGLRRVLLERIRVEESGLECLRERLSRLDGFAQSAEAAEPPPLN